MPVLILILRKSVTPYNGTPVSENNFNFSDKRHSMIYEYIISIARSKR